jgi:Heavy-metal resistance
MATTLPPADAAILRRAFNARIAVIRDNQAQMAGFPDRVLAAVGAEPFRIDAVATALADGQTSRNVFEEAIAAAVLDAIGQMSPEGRHRIAAWQPDGADRIPPPPPDRR